MNRPGATAHDIAAYILKKMKICTHMKLQKLVYYSQAWSLVWLERPLFKDKIQAWANGPVVPAIYRTLRGEYQVVPKDLPQGDPAALADDDKKAVDAVLDFYGDKSPQWLSDLTHAEQPWIMARKGIPAGERGANEITLASMEEYYSSL